MKQLGLVAAAILAAGLGFLVWHWPRGVQFSFSQHAATRRLTIVYYIALFTLVLPLLVTFFIGWFVPVMHLSAWVTGFVVVAAVAQYSFTLIPEVGGWRTRFHRFMAAVSAVCLVPPIVLLALAGSVSLVGRVAAALCLGVMLVIIWASIRHRGQHQKLLLLQTIYFIAFFMAVLTATYIR